jgi:peptidyl-dipeptidase Dcp
MDAMMDASNPLLAPWHGPFELPPFHELDPAHFAPAFEQACAAHRTEIAAIAESPEPADFPNTIDALERAGSLLRKVSAVFHNLTSTDATPALQAIERDVAPRLARHRSDIFLNERLFQRIDALHRAGVDGGLSAEQRRVLDRYHLAFKRNGAGLAPEIKARLADIGARLATLGTQFSQNVLADETAFMLVLEAPEDLAGLPEPLIAAAAAAAEERGLPGKHIITLSRSSVEPFLHFSARRDLREAAFRAWSARGAGGGATDNRAIMAETVRLRAERARLLGYPTFAAYRLADSMAKTPQAVEELLRLVWTQGRARALREQDVLQAMIATDGENFEIAPWDWRYYAERRRKSEFDLDEAEIKPYFQLDRLIDAAFDTAHRLFGVSFTPRPDIGLYHPDARAWTVNGADGAPVGLFIGDYYTRLSKRSGAWMNAFRSQQKLDGVVLPIIINVLNYVKPAPGEACLLSFDDARTLFHEFGHALHGLLSDVTYPMIAGTNVVRDFVEFPSQLFEHWLEQPEVLRRFAVHHVTGEPLPEALMQRLLGARQFNQGFATVEYTASALVDLSLHSQADVGDIDVIAFEARTLEALGMPKGIAMRHRTPHFAHIFSDDGYSSAYYSYLWSEILDADGFDAFEATGDVFDPATAKRLRDYVYAAGNSRDPEEAYRAFRGRSPTPEALLRKRGLMEVSAAAE